jgi:OOP family OmpA-OmpF porin
MAPFSLRFTIIMLTVSFAAAAHGQMGDWYVAPSVIFNDDDGDRNIDDSLSGGQVTAGRDLTKNLTLEGLLGYSSIKGYTGPPVFDIWPDQKHLDLSANLLAYFNRDSMFAPYLLVGVGYLLVDAKEGAQFLGNTGRDDRPTASYGLGLKWRMGQSNYSIRAEHRVRTAFDNENLTDQLTTIGVQYDFGGTKSDIGVPETNKDSDGDGVLDIWDACDNTPPGVEVTSRGCELKNLDRDDDEDHINNNNDQCPNTPIGVAVDRVGCSFDSDMDGVPTGQDRCPASRAGADVNEYGCENDEDDDGVLDHHDSCLNTRPGARTDVKGCEIKDIISLPGVNFETGHDILLPGTEYLLQTAADTLKKHPDLQIEVAGHSDDVGNADQNIGLSMRRAKTVRNFLIQYGVAENRLTFKGYGEAQPIADNSTADGRATNRRVELRLVTR